MEFKDGNKLKGYLHNESKKLHINSNSIYTMFFLRSFLENINHQNFVFVGGISHFANTKYLYRPLTDGDAITDEDTIEATYKLEKELTQNISPIKYQMKEKFITTRNTACLKIICHFDHIQHMIKFDIAKEQPQDLKKDLFPPILTNDKPIPIKHISLEENIANKMYVLLTELTKNHMHSKDLRRFKDLYDLYHLVKNHPYDEKKVKTFLNNNFEKYQEIDQKLADSNYLDDHYIKKNKEQYQKKSQQFNFRNDDDFKDVVEATKEHLSKITK